MQREAAAREAREAQIRTVRHGRTLQRQHKDLLIKQSREVEEALQGDLKMLEEMEATEAYNRQAVSDKRTQAVEDVEWMKAEVKRQLEQEQERQQTFDTLYQDEAQRMYAKQEAVWDREKNAREKLMHNVLAERRGQMQAKAETLREQRAASLQQRQQLIRLIDNEKMATARDVQTRRDEISTRKEELDRQVKLRQGRAQIMTQNGAKIWI